MNALPGAEFNVPDWAQEAAAAENSQLEGFSWTENTESGAWIKSRILPERNKK